MNQAPSFVTTRYTGSIVPTIPGHDRGNVFSVAASPTGLITAAGTSSTPGVAWELFVARFDADGRLDPSFGGDGAVHVVHRGRDTFSEGAVHVLPDGTTLLGGRSWGGGNDYVSFVARVTADGEIDAAFGQRGFSEIAESGLVFTSIDVDVSTGLIYAVGYIPGAGYRLVSLLPDGRLNNAFGTNGVRAMPTSAYWSSVRDLDVTPEGNLIATLEPEGVKQLHAFDVTGSPLLSFGDHGVVVLDRLLEYTQGSASIAIGGDGAVYVLAGTAFIGGRYVSAVLKLDANGVLDTAFGANGFAFGDIDLTHSQSSLQLAIDQSGAIFVLASRDDAGQESAVLSRFTPQGLVDASFGERGTVEFFVGERDQNITTALQLHVLGIGRDGSVFAGGQAWDGDSEELALARFNANGSPVAAFSGERVDTSSSTIDFIAGYPGVAINPGVAVTDRELGGLGHNGDYGGSSLRITREDGGAIGSNVSALGRTELVGGQVLLGGKLTGNYERSESAFKISFTHGTSEAEVHEVMRSLAFRTTETLDEIKLDWVFSDGGSAIDSTDAMQAYAVATFDVSAPRESASYWINSLFEPGPQGDNRAGYITSLLGDAKIYSVTFPTTPPSYLSAAERESFLAVSPTQVDGVRTVLRSIESFADIRFVESSATEQLRTLAFYNARSESGSSLHAYYPNSVLVGSDVSLGYGFDISADNSYGYWHEIGHALGLKHPHEAPTMPSMDDNGAYTVMTYTYSKPGFFVLDVAALQYVYGPNPHARSGDDTYSITEDAPNFIWDGAGTDTLSAASISRPVTLHLESGKWDFVDERGMTITSAGQVTVNFGSLIENLVGGSGSDRLFGNDAANRITGGAGNDLIVGGDGNDSAGYSSTHIGFTVGKVGAAFVVKDNVGPEGTDTLTQTERLEFSDKGFELVNLPRTQAPVYGKDRGFLFDGVYYLLSNPELAPAITLSTALQDYFTRGASLHFKPNAWFDAQYYSSKWADLAPLHLDEATLFMHYNLYGVWEGRSAGPKFDHFDGNRYLVENSDVAAYVDSNLSAFLGSRNNGAIAHFVIYGANEERAAFDSVGQQIKLDYIVDL